MITKVHRLGPGDEGSWRTAVEQIISPEDRDEQLITESEVLAALTDSRCYMFLATINGEAVGLLSAYRFPDLEAGGSLVYLYDIEVTLSHRGNGIGRDLIVELMSFSQSDGVKLIWAGTEGNNTSARRAFESTKGELTGVSYVEYEWELEE
ncbi:MAG: GNAT family N-acetyltransferase [Nitrosomonadaceae bacterium]